MYNEDYTQATLELSTDTFFTDGDAKKIVQSGGEVEGYLIWIEIDKNKKVYVHLRFRKLAFPKEVI